MRFNDKELVDIGTGPAELEGRLNHRRATGGNFNQSGFKERWFKLKSNLLFYFRINELGKIDHKEPLGVIVLENSNVQYELSTGVPFSFSLIFRDDPDKKHYFSGRSESHVGQWVMAMKQASYEYWRSQLILLQTKLNSLTGKDPLLMYPHNEGVIRDIQASSSPLGERKLYSKTASFQSHMQNVGNKALETFKSHCQDLFESDNEQEKPVQEVQNLIEL